MHSKKDLERISKMFDSYIKKILKNYRTDYIRKNRGRWDNECFIEDLAFSKREGLLKMEEKSEDSGIHMIDGKIITDEMIHRVVGSLPEKKSVVITLHYFDEVSDEDIAQILGITRKGVNARRKAALKLLRQLLEDPEDEKEE